MKPVNFTDLTVWQLAHSLVLEIYKTTDKFPVKDAFGLISQMQRIALSVTSNIAEGFSRQLPKDKTHFYVMARGSLAELQSQLMVARDAGRVDRQQYDELASKADDTHALLHGLIKSTKNRTN
ncbi:four helix bundle protein [Candidatus Microgenomates bacterium]|nr:four helix bundle protein [Candidatus Microgenomates bacterium]